MTTEQSNALEVAYRECVHDLYALAFKRWCLRPPEEVSSISVGEIIRQLEDGLKKAVDLKNLITMERREK